jgi:ABC-type multidrug transport system permease subunit
VYVEQRRNSVWFTTLMIVVVALMVAIGSIMVIVFRER